MQVDLYSASRPLFRKSTSNPQVDLQSASRPPIRKSTSIPQVDLYSASRPLFRKSISYPSAKFVSKFSKNIQIFFHFRFLNLKLTNRLYFIDKKMSLTILNQ